MGRQINGATPLPRQLVKSQYSNYVSISSTEEKQKFIVQTGMEEVIGKEKKHFGKRKIKRGAFHPLSFQNKILDSFKTNCKTGIHTYFGNIWEKSATMLLIYSNRFKKLT